MFSFIGRLIKHLVKRTVEIMRDMAIGFGLLRITGLVL